MLFFYVRHGDPIYNPDSLTELGKRQADAVAKRLSLFGIDKIFASTSTRAIQTAEPTAALTKKEIVQLDFCNECYAWDDFTCKNENGGISWPFYNNRCRKAFVSPEMKKLGENWFDHPEFAEERDRFKNGIERVNKGVDELFLSLDYEHDRENGCYKSLKENNHDRVALFAHQGFGAAFMSSVLDIPYPQYCSHFDMCHTGVTVIEFSEGDGVVIPRVLMVSNDSHLFKESLPMHYNYGYRF